MAGLLYGEPRHNGTPEGTHRGFQQNPEENGDRWYLSRKEIEENSPSRRDGIDLKKETHLRKTYCTFLQDLGMRLKVPQVTIATAIIFSHRFFLRQSHLTNDRRTIATVCMFLACKVEETPRPLKDVIMVSYEMIHKKDPAALQKIKQKDIYEQQKELVLLGERVVLGTLGYNLNVYHPYKPLVEGIKRFKVAQGTLAQVAWNFVNDGLRTSMCLQFKPHLIAAGAIFLAAKFLKVKLPTDRENIWWQEFDVNPRQLEEVSNQMLELYEQNRALQPQASEAEGSVGTIERNPPLKGPQSEEHITSHSTSHTGSTSKASSSLKVPVPDQSFAKSNSPPKISQTRNNNSETKTDVPAGREDGEMKHSVREDNNNIVINNDTVEVKDKCHGKNSSPQDSSKKLDREKLKAAFERRKALVDITRKEEPMDELERELEDIEVPIERKLNQSRSNGFEAVEEGEVEASNDVGRKRKSTSPLDRNGYSEREHKRQMHENHV